MTSTAERQADEITGPQYGRIISFSVAAGGTDTVDLEDAALNPEGASHPGYWQGRYVTIQVETNDCQFALAEDALDVLTPGVAPPALPALTTDRGAAALNDFARANDLPGNSCNSRAYWVAPFRSGRLLLAEPCRTARDSVRTAPAVAAAPSPWVAT